MQSAKMIDIVTLNLLLKFIASPFLEMRIRGLNEINKYIARPGLSEHLENQAFRYLEEHEICE